MNERHGQRFTALYGVWRTMHTRCYNQRSEKYPLYGGKGITVCEAWHSFGLFSFWSYENGYVPGMTTLDRIKNSEPYSPDNCRWVDQKTQQRNRTNNVYITAFGETKLRVEWIEDPRCKVSFHTLRRRLKLGWSPEDAISRDLTTNQGRML